MNSAFEHLAAAKLAWRSAFLLAICCTALCSCGGRPNNSGPYIEFTRVPLADEGGPETRDLIEGRVIGARANQEGQQIVLFARADAWYVQPFADEPFTQIQPDSKWRSSTHLGTEYAALLVEAGYQPPSSTAELPAAGGQVIAVASAKGVPVFWRRWWFLGLCALAIMSVLLAFYSFRLHTGARQLSLRFEERLAERTQIAQELHDTLLQGVISASMQLHVAVDRVPEDLPAKPSLTHVLHVMGKVIDEGGKALQRLGSSAAGDSFDVEQAFHRIRNEFAGQGQTSFRVTVEGRPRPVHPIIRDEVHRIGRDALANALRRAGAKRIEVEVGYKAQQLRVVIRDDGRAQDDYSGDCGLSAMRGRAQAVGARLRVRSRAPIGTEVELSVPAAIAFQDQPSRSKLRRFATWRPRDARQSATEAGKQGTL